MSEWKDTFMMSRPNEFSTEQIYLDDAGGELQWYENSVSEEGFIECIVNKHPESNKRFQAIKIQSKIAPYRVEFRTENHYSFLVAADFELLEDGFWSPIKMDATESVENPTGSNDIDTSPLWGYYLRVKIFFAVGVRQSIKHLIIKAQVQHRTVQQ